MHAGTHGHGLGGGRPHAMRPMKGVSWVLERATKLQKWPSRWIRMSHQLMWLLTMTPGPHVPPSAPPCCSLLLVDHGMRLACVQGQLCQWRLTGQPCCRGSLLGPLESQLVGSGVHMML